ncbi:MBL fold metallo-hydrolase [Thermoflexus hugenholtzii]|uniref:L-ascorbate metabolism protein UlaG, beta-lactamase superfamily n=1 Tax=Thermoflexus hugenholtzii JAD2 TaxID=877466 RepID=A0A212PZ42_9CHLR|nr:MBL fold metallo-hydrolase [Thermoflexus hugenholtzii]SNB52283.1 L-ascorbate metabolism protein UlaG, beta-lactamase superfamily [Thermoflexus hugenholtzii JAD2]
MEARPRLLDRIHWLGHDAFRIDGPPVIYLDPWQIPAGAPKADLILISHEHFDHCSPEDINRLRQPDTVIIGSPAAAAKIKGARAMRPGERLSVKGVEIEAVPAYNINKRFHPREAGGLGFVLTIEGERLYFAGDTDFIPEMKEIRCDIALLPVSGTYVMTAEEAAQAAAAIQPKVAIPMHYGAGVAGTEADAERFRSLYKGAVVILKPER